MKISHLIFLVIIFSSCQYESKKVAYNTVSENEKTSEIIKQELDLIKTKKKAEEALVFCKRKKLNTDICILIDMSLHSGLNRFVIWDFKEQKVVNKYLVGHGCGNNTWSSDESKDNPEFSNKDGSHLSALGKYQLGERGRSDWGIHVKYLMHGLEKTNNNALKRFIVFHSWELMSDKEIYPKGSPEGWGCPTISNNAMKELDPIIQNSEKPLLMWIYNE
ncbi:murein L,D-transpeptidase catalytic domain family protein [Chryseobacterium sp. LC2016-29]|uniref:murein L,D-transpeptidase catalytic domain-containing protein n=1 Tax=Chryseobacterium sp. LC2016-29 TaxID=2897331 RepID=UPI001E2DD8B4|nr:murein L,D-transpeptidase catalytic domain family protein [Chryseobacterium sp. LC2016-29]MCD0477591.1 murein L,D-transpeptidase catalytic domain family protein [Chryseobacterium sp. LC2016-29]